MICHDTYIVSLFRFWFDKIEKFFKKFFNAYSTLFCFYYSINMFTSQSTDCLDRLYSRLSRANEVSCHMQHPAKKRIGKRSLPALLPMRIHHSVQNFFQNPCEFFHFLRCIECRKADAQRVAASLQRTMRCRRTMQSRTGTDARFPQLFRNLRWGNSVKAKQEN